LSRQFRRLLPRPEQPRPQASQRPRLETLEDRLAPAAFTVTDTSDDASDSGSLRYAVNHLGAGPNRSSFDPSLAGQTISLTGGELVISKDVTILGPGADRLTVDGRGDLRRGHLLRPRWPGRQRPWRRPRRPQRQRGRERRHLPSQQRRRRNRRARGVQRQRWWRRLRSRRRPRRVYDTSGSTVMRDAATLIFHNRATTSGDDTFGF
jgi:hypothetical protein